MKEWQIGYRKDVHQMRLIKYLGKGDYGMKFAESVTKPWLMWKFDVVYRNEHLVNIINEGVTDRIASVVPSRPLSISPFQRKLQREFG